jgi:NADH-quinone oxidoreductase subunit M
MNLGFSPLSLVIFFPLVGFLVILFLKENRRSAILWTGLITSILEFGLAIWILVQFKPAVPGMQMEINLPWLKIGGTTIGYHLGIDGLSILMLLLTTFLMPIAILSAWKAVNHQLKGFLLTFLLLETSLVGVFLALDLVLFYIFLVFALVPMYFLIGIWGGERRIYASIKFFLFTMAGSIFMLAAIIVTGMTAGSFSLTDLIGGGAISAGLQFWLFLGFGIAFAVKVPLWPFHSWLPDAHTEAPTAGSVILAGVLLKMGAYGFLRFCISMFPEATRQLAPWMAGLAVIGILYGAMVAFRQKDMKKLVAYSSVSHLGFVILGLFALNVQSVEGSVLQMVNHGLSTGALFLIVGMIYERRHTRDLDQFGGLWKAMPVLGGFALIITLSSMALPGLNGFVGEFNILAGAFNSQILASPWFAGIATLGVILAAIYLLHFFQKVFLGPLTKPENQVLKDLSLREIFTLGPVLVLIFWIGLYPKPFLDLIGPAVTNILAIYK